MSQVTISDTVNWVASAYAEIGPFWDKKLNFLNIGAYWLACMASAGWWSGFFFWASIVSLIGLGISEIASHRYSERKDELVTQQQLTEKKQHDDQIARLHLETANANADAAKARAEQERLKAQLAWRVLPPEAVNRLKEILSARPGKINVQHVANDPEATYLAIQIANLFGEAKWQIQMLSVTMGGAVVFGLWIPDSPAPDTVVVRAAFLSVGITFSTDALPPAGMAFGGTLADAPILFVGSKPIAVQ